MSNEQKVGLFFLVGAALALVAIETTVGTGLLKRGYHLYVTYPDVGGLRTGDQVNVAGVKLGSVDEITLEPSGVRVRLNMEKDAVVRQDSVASLEAQLLSGGRFVAISLGSASAPVLKDGDSVPGEMPPDIADAMEELKSVAESVRDLADSLNENQDRLLNNLNGMIEENRTAIQQTLDNLGSLTAKLDRGEGTLAKLINDATLYDNVSAMMADLQQVSQRLARGEGDLGKLVNSDGSLYDDVREAVARLNNTASNLEEVSSQIRDGEGTLGRMVADDSLYQDAQSAVRGLDRAAASIEDQSPISVLGTLVTTLF